MEPPSQRVNNPPNAASLMFTARSFGKYDLAAAIADLIDNSIKAKSTLVEISCPFLDGYPEVRIRDDGTGMSKGELLTAMRPACINPNDDRSPDDLGRFGWGMKSASFSQCKILTVITQSENEINGASWNLDDIDDWAMNVYEADNALAKLSRPFKGCSGTELIWTNCDRLSEGHSTTQELFNELIMTARRKLSLIFHRYLNGEAGIKEFEITINGTPIDRVDPYCSTNDATIPSPEEVTNLPNERQIRMKAFTLPHFSKLTNEEYELSEGEEGYVKNQGFYIYRNYRLIMHGTWFQLAKHGELSKLVRIRVDIPNSLDDMWKITVDKSDAQLPVALRKRMKDLIDGFRITSSRVFRSKGGKIGCDSISSVWQRHSKNQTIKYSINRTHPYITALKETLPLDNRGQLVDLLQLIETEIPIDAIFSEVSANPQKVLQNSSSKEDFLKQISRTIPFLMTHHKNIDELIAILKNSEPYSSNWPVVEEHLKAEKII